MFAAIGLAWKLGGFRGIAKLVPRWAWIVLAVVIVCGAAYWYHGRQVARFADSIRVDERARVNAQWKSAFDKMQQAAAIWKQRYETESTALATTRRKGYEEGLRTDAARASVLRNSGPGAARCGQVNNPRLPAGSSGHNAGSGPVDANMGGMPSEAGVDLAAVPFAEFVDRAKLCDANRSEVVTWRLHDAEQRALRGKMLSEPTKDPR